MFAANLRDRSCGTVLLGGIGLLLAACGFADYDYDYDDDWWDPDSGASIEGRILLSEGDGPGVPEGAILEAEPNDTHDTAHYLGEIEAGDVVVVHGHTTSVDDSDPFDGFQLVARKRVEITATLDFPQGHGNDFDLGLYDPISLQFVEVYLAATAPEVGTFHAKGVFNLIVAAYTGQGDYVLTIRARTPASPIREIEPNDTSDGARFLGELAVGDTVRVSGTANDFTDPTDGVLVSFPAATRLRVTLTFPGGDDYDLNVYDATEDVELADHLKSFASASANPESGTVAVSGATLLYIEVEAWDGRGAWTLELSAEPPTALVMTTRVDAGGRLAAASAERGRLRRAPHAPLYGRPRHDIVPGEALVGFLDDDPVAETAVQKRGGNISRRRGTRRARVRFEVSTRLDAEDQRRFTLSRIAALRGSPGVRYAEPNYRVYAFAEPDDTYYNLQWHYPLIHLDDAWDVAKGSASIIVAVIDTGQTDHPDLAGRQIAGYDFISDAANARDGNGRDPDPTDEGDLLGPSGRSSFHGTHVAGTIGAATNNDRGVAGITWQTRIMHLRVLGREGGTTEDVAEAIRYAARLPNDSGALPAERAHVINMSLGGGDWSQTLQDAITAARNAGVVIVAAAGNESTSAPSYPAAHTGVVSVSAVDLNANLAPYSNTGSTIDIAAPGGDSSVDRNGDGYVDGVLSTLLDDSSRPPEVVYAFYQGTSMAAPHVAGVAALVLGVDPSLTPSQVEAILTSTATDLGRTGRDDDYGHGLLNAHAAVLAAGSGGGGGSGPPALVVTPAALDFGSTVTELSAHVTNVGGGFLEVDTVTVTTQDGHPWLSASTTGSGDDTRNVDAIRIGVNRSGLPQNSYSGRVTITSNDGTRDVQVLMSVVSGVGRILDAPVYVLAIDPVTGDTVEEVVLDPRLGLDFTLRGLAPGSYYVAAGTDLDDDGYICDEGEWCGMYPVGADPLEITVGDGEFHSGVEFVMEPVTQLDGAAAGDGDCGFRRR